MNHQNENNSGLAQPIMWQAVVTTGDITQFGISSTRIEKLPGLYPTSNEAMAVAEAAMNARPEIYQAASRRVSL